MAKNRGVAKPRWDECNDCKNLGSWLCVRCGAGENFEAKDGDTWPDEHDMFNLSSEFTPDDDSQS